MSFGLWLLARNPNVGLELCYSNHEGEHRAHVGQDEAVTEALGKPKEASDTHRIWHALAHLTFSMEINRLRLKKGEERRGL